LLHITCHLCTAKKQAQALKKRREFTRLSSPRRWRGFSVSPGGDRTGCFLQSDYKSIDYSSPNSDK
ncbi:hypothetical protein, partial [Salmonella enterica]|uniref:hypothetical protein n=1 Tax=Salmonella enterica TaxID=28901 RepID=UPI00344F4BBD